MRVRPATQLWGNGNFKFSREFLLAGIFVSFLRRETGQMWTVTHSHSGEAGSKRGPKVQFAVAGLAGPPSKDHKED